MEDRTAEMMRLTRRQRRLHISDLSRTRLYAVTPRICMAHTIDSISITRNMATDPSRVRVHLRFITDGSCCVGHGDTDNSLPPEPLQLVLPDLRPYHNAVMSDNYSPVRRLWYAISGEKSTARAAFQWYRRERRWSGLVGLTPGQNTVVTNMHGR